MMISCKDANGKIHYVGSHSCCCGKDIKKTKKDDDGYYTECLCCGLRSKSTEDKNLVVHFWNVMVREMFSKDNDYNFVEKCCSFSKKKLLFEDEKFWYKCENCDYESKKGKLSDILINWNQDLRDVRKAITLLEDKHDKHFGRYLYI